MASALVFQVIKPSLLTDPQELRKLLLELKDQFDLISDVYKPLDDSSYAFDIDLKDTAGNVILNFYMQDSTILLSPSQKDCPVTKKITMYLIEQGYCV